MTITKQVAKDLVEGKGDNNFELYDDYLKGIGDNGGIERFCIVKEIETGRLFRFIYEKKPNENSVYYRDVQLFPVKENMVTRSEYTEVDNLQVHIKEINV